MTTAAYMQMSHPEQMLFALLRSALHQKEAEAEPFRQAGAEQWKACYHLACQQGVMALAWDGARTLAADCQPPQSVRLAWALAVDRYEQVYKHYCQVASSLSRFYRQHGIEMVQFKGVGYSTEYPYPSHRQGGDIDIYTFAMEGSGMTDKEATDSADELMRQEGAIFDNHNTYKHSHFNYKRIPIENHKFFLNVKHFDKAAEFNALLIKHLQPEERVLEGTDFPVKVPSPTFNSLFLAYHAAQHYGCGMKLHHLFDWAVLLKNHGLCLTPEMRDPSFMRFVSALTVLSNRLLGTCEEATAEERLMDEMLHEMLHPRFEESIPPMSKLKLISYKTRRMIYHHKLKYGILHSSTILRTVWSSIIAHIKRPETIFSRG